MKRKELTVIVCGFLVLLMTIAVWASPVTHTGLTNCYDADGKILTPCPSDPDKPFYGQDANYVINPMSYTKLGENGKELPDSATEWKMVRDNVTGLIWEIKNQKDGKPDPDNTQDSDNTYTWYNSNSTSNGGNPGTKDLIYDTEVFINTLNSIRYGGFSDWRLPTLQELDSIVNYNISSSEPTINTHLFPEAQFSDYWTSTSCDYNSSFAWAVSFLYGYDDPMPKNNDYHVRAVRGNPSQPVYKDNNDGTVSDISTGLMWQKGTADKMTWEEALDYCVHLPLAGYTDWRLPTQKELRSLVDYSSYYPAINTAFFPTTVSNNYWSSTTDTVSPQFAWCERFTDGYDSKLIKIYECYVRAVRGGHPGPVAKCQDIIIPAGSNCTAEASIDNGSFDPAGHSITISQMPSGPYSIGSRSVTLTASYSSGESNHCTGSVTVVDTTPPTITNASASPSEIWSRNGQMVNVTINYDSEDKCSKTSCRISGVTCNESIKKSDYTIVDAHHVQLKANRSRKSNGRVYTITITCTDSSGNSSNQSVNVTETLPHTQTTPPHPPVRNRRVHNKMLNAPN